MKRVLYGVLAALVGVMLLAAVFFRRQASTAPVRLSDRYLDAVTSLRLHFPDGSSFAPDYINKDFLHVLNLWEIDEIASDSQTHALRAQEPVTLTLKNKNRTVYKKKGYKENGNFYLDAGRKGLYKMRCDYLPNTWAGFFDPASPLWQNHLLLDLHYYEIRSVTLFTPADVSASDGAVDVNATDGADRESSFLRIKQAQRSVLEQKNELPRSPGRTKPTSSAAKTTPTPSATPSHAPATPPSTSPPPKPKPTSPPTNKSTTTLSLPLSTPSPAPSTPLSLKPRTGRCRP